jgi:small redox-active disulfide protein 2
VKIEVLGPGCPRCHHTLEAVRQAVAELGLAADVAYVTDLKEIMKAGVFSTPAVVVDGDVKMVGKVPTVPEVKKMLQEAAGNRVFGGLA